MTNRNLALDKDTNDFIVDSSGQLVLTPDLEFEVAQRIQNRLLWFMGEWWLDLDGGVPYYSEILKKRPDLNNIRSIFLTQINQVEGVEKVLQLDTTLNSADRTYFVKFTVLAEETIIEGEVTI